MPVFVAQIQFQFEAENVAAGGRRLRELQTAASTVGFTLKLGRVETESSAESDQQDWTQYAP